MTPLGQRTAVSTTGEAFAQSPADWTWIYDALGQITKANTDQYTYDQIGNRRTSGKQNGAQTDYTTNALNQYTAVHTTEPAYDADGNQLTGLTATAALPDRSTLTFTWNADNRPIEIKQNGEPKELRTYDHMGRRIRKGDTLTLYDGYNAIAEYNLNTRTLKTTYAWGNDLSGTPQGAGGVGGLLSVTEHDKQTPLVSYPCYDGNGNITEYLTEENGGTLTAHYQYDAFGNVTKKTGEREYNYQFSTKPYDALTGMNYYNYRDYDPVNGRWINRDPIGEMGGMNLYGFIKNSFNSFDYIGMNSDIECAFYEQNPDRMPAAPCQKEVEAMLDAVKALMDGYEKMKKANVIGADKWFHCLAMCNATRSSDSPNTVLKLAALREISDLIRSRFGSAIDSKTRKVLSDVEHAMDSLEDMKANRTGIDCPEEKTCECCCDEFRVNGV